jgi:hypothetical protein
MITVQLKEFDILNLPFNFLNVSNIIDQSFADASSSNITRLLLLMPMACQEFNGNWIKNKG